MFNARGFATVPIDKYNQTKGLMYQPLCAVVLTAAKNAYKEQSQANTQFTVPNNVFIP